MYRFKSGKYAGKTLERIMLRDASGIYRLVTWAKDKPHLGRMVTEFNRLRRKLRYAPVYVDCAQPRCSTKAKWMTLPMDYRGRYLPSPYYWCSKHEPWEDSGISPKLPIDFDVIELFKDKQDRKAIQRHVREALGIKKGTKITEDFAHSFFVKLP